MAQHRTVSGIKTLFIIKYYVFQYADTQARVTQKTWWCSQMLAFTDNEHAQDFRKLKSEIYHLNKFRRWKGTDVDGH